MIIRQKYFPKTLFPIKNSHVFLSEKKSKEKKQPYFVSITISFVHLISVNNRNKWKEICLSEGTACDKWYASLHDVGQDILPVVLRLKTYVFSLFLGMVFS